MNNISDAQLTAAFDAAVKGKRFPLPLMTICLCIGACIAFAHNTTPAPFFDVLLEYYAMDPVNDAALLNLSLSIIFPFFVIFSFVGTKLESKIGTRNLTSLFMIILSIGVLLTFVSFNYPTYLIGRCLYGVGFGLHIPTFGSAIAKWYRPKAREFMTALYGIFPLLGALVCFVTFPIVAQAVGGGNLGDGWMMGAAFTGIISLVVAIIWIVSVRKDVDDINLTKTQDIATGMIEEESTSVFSWLLKQREVKSIMVTFICDFTVYAYIATILPYWLMTSGSMDAVTANVWSAIAFPLLGVIGVAIGATLTTKLGVRKPIIVVAQIIKLVGCLIAGLLGGPGGHVFVIVGAMLFGAGNGMWMSPMFMIPTELPGTNSTRVAGGFSLFLSSGYVFGFFMPIVGGVLTTVFATQALGADPNLSTDFQMAYGYKNSYLIISLSHIVAVISALTLRETGPGKKKKAQAAAE